MQHSIHGGYINVETVTNLPVTRDNKGVQRDLEMWLPQPIT